jgi:hypothetical protein
MVLFGSRAVGRRRSRDDPASERVTAAARICVFSYLGQGVRARQEALVLSSLGTNAQIQPRPPQPPPHPNTHTMKNAQHTHTRNNLIIRDGFSLILFNTLGVGVCALRSLSRRNKSIASERSLQMYNTVWMREKTVLLRVDPHPVSLDGLLRNKKRCARSTPGVRKLYWQRRARFWRTTRAH